MSSFLERLEEGKRVGKAKEREEARQQRVEQIAARQRQREEAMETRRQAQKERKLAEGFFRESGVLALLGGAQKIIRQKGYNEVSIRFQRDDTTVGASLYWGKRSRRLVWDGNNGILSFETSRDCGNIISVEADSDGTITIPSANSKHAFSLEDWRGNRSILEDGLWEAYLHPLKYDLDKERYEERRRREAERYPSDPWSGFEGRGECLPGDSLISTPCGLIPIKELMIGDLVWTINRAGNRLRVPIIRKIRRAVSPNYKIAHVTLIDGRQLYISPGHPAIDYKPISDLAAGDVLDKVRISRLSTIFFTGRCTFDILPAGDTGGYWANNILLGSTLSDKFNPSAISFNKAGVFIQTASYAILPIPDRKC